VAGVTISRAAAAASGALEACGLLLGTGERIETATIAANVAADPARRFEIDPAHLLAAHRAARGGGASIIGYWHSHPSGLVGPSATDAAMADPDGRVWAIVAGGAIRCFRAGPHGALHGRFDPIAAAFARD
jgi:proteasome lid subunit RPN8/RPN11